MLKLIIIVAVCGTCLSGCSLHCIHGTCVLTGKRTLFTCQCNHGYTGVNCDKHVCDGNPCGQHGRCSVSGSSYTCACIDGYHGSKCQYGPCTLVSCGHHGACVEQSQSPFYACLCAAGYSGNTCQHDACHGENCSGQGMCFLQPTTPYFECTCQPGFTGIHCEIASHWSDWSRMTSCSVTCGSGFQSRQRSCVGAQTACVGSSRETTTCNLQPCKAASTWTVWSEWAGCGVTCGAGTQTRLRICNKPDPSAADCAGHSKETQPLILPACPGCSALPPPPNGMVNVLSNEVGGVAMFSCSQGYVLNGTTDIFCLQTLMWSGLGPTCVLAPATWSDWSPWASSGETCDSETISRYRMCNKPNPQAVCVGTDSDFHTNPLAPCPACPTPSNPTNGQVMTTGSHVGATAIYSCNSGFVINGHTERYCLDSHTWSGQDITCSIV